MSTYAIGDVQGCHRTLLALVEACDVDPSRDEIWLAGDLVNRGPASAEVLRWARENESFVRVVLGNHDMHLLARWRGVGHAKRKDTLDGVLAARDGDELLEWLIERPFVHGDENRLMVHAGLLPFWSASKALELAAEAGEALRGPKGTRLLERLSTKREAPWEDGLKGLRRHEAVIRSLCNLRVCDANGQAHFGFTDAPEDAPPPLRPWYEVPGRRSANTLVVCGHWAAQGLRMRDGLIALDTGAVWGNHLTAVRLEDRAVTQVPLRDRLSDRQWALRVGPGTRRGKKL